MKIASLAIAFLASSASAFVPQKTTTTSFSSSSLRATNWSPDPSAFAYGLPGAVSPFGDGFDPLGLATDKSLEELKYYREAETTHGRVAMLAVLGFLVQENPINFHPLFDAQGKNVGPAIYHLDYVRSVLPSFFTLLATFIGFAELQRALKGWKAPTEGPWTLQDGYYPGDIGFDPLGLKPSDPAEFAELSAKELQNGRLAMLASMGFIAQELVNQKQIVETLTG